jgi:transcriptional regulator with XRE-family HTH domain
MQERMPNTKLKRGRELRGWSQAKVARELGTTRLTISRWESGKHTPEAFYQEQLCTLFGKNTEELGFIHPIPQETPPTHIASIAHIHQEMYLPEERNLVTWGIDPQAISVIAEGITACNILTYEHIARKDLLCVMQIVDSYISIFIR